METFLHKMRTNFYNVELNKAKLEVYIYRYIYICIVVGPMLKISSQNRYSSDLEQNYIGPFFFLIVSITL